MKAGATPEWTVRIAGRCSRGPFTEETADRVLDHLGQYGPALSYRPERMAIRMTVPAPDAGRAVALALAVIGALGLHLVPTEIAASDADARRQPAPPRDPGGTAVDGSPAIVGARG